jgi:hypothetical protein
LQAQQSCHQFKRFAIACPEIPLQNNYQYFIKKTIFVIYRKSIYERTKQTFFAIIIALVLG